MDALDLDATGQAALVAAGEVGPAELVEAAARRIEELDPLLGALVTRRPEGAAADIGSGVPPGPFSGVPMVVKDAVQHTAGDRYQHGMRFLRDHPWTSPHDTELVRRFRAAGLVVMGRSKVPELTVSPTTEPLAHGPARNPWDLRRTPGGSSGGSAVAVASGMVAIGHGNDMGGSIRIPASCCGLVGLKPSRHRTSVAPDHGEYWGPLIHEHVLCRSVRDCAGVLDAVAGAVPGDLHMAPPPQRPWAEEVGAPVRGLRAGVLDRAPKGTTVDERCAEATRRTARLLEEMGLEVDVAPAEPFEDEGGPAALGTIVAAGIARSVVHWERLLSAPVTDLEPRTAMMVGHGRTISATDLMAAVDRLAQWSRRVAGAYAAYDVLVTPMMATMPPELGVMAAERPMEEVVGTFGAMTRFAMPFDASGQPAMSVPMAVADGLPVGVQLVAAYGREDVLFRVASALEEATGWLARRPPVPGAPGAPSTGPSGQVPTSLRATERDSAASGSSAPAMIAAAT